MSRRHSEAYCSDLESTQIYLHHAPLEHAAHDEHGVWRPLDVLDGVQTGVQVENLKGLRVPDHQAVLGAAGHVAAIRGEPNQLLGLLESL